MEQRINILVADDEPSVTSSLLWALQPLGHTIGVVNDGEQALARLTADSTDLLITDHSMPRLGGLELVRRLRATPYKGKVLVLSAHLTHDNRAAYEALGVDAMMSKPFDVGALRQAVQELFRDHMPATL